MLNKNAIRMHLYHYLENSCPPHLKKDMVELGQIPRKAARISKDVTQFLQKDHVSGLGFFRFQVSSWGSDLYLTQKG